MDPGVIETRIRRASILIGAGLLVQFLALLRIHPLWFVTFLMIGCPLVGLGIVLYLIALIHPGPATPAPAHPPEDAPK